MTTGKAEMFFKQFYLGCLAQASYMIGSGGVAVVVDPRRDIDIYLNEAAAHGLVIRHVVETHLHADFVSGHRELAEATGATIHIGAKANAGFEHTPISDGDELVFGDVILRFLETPGHTPESVCIVVIVRSRPDVPEAVLTGDTLFVGDAGRPDLLGAAMPAEVLAGMLYDSLHEKLLRLPDSVKIYPAHGAGSMCGKNISKESSSTIGEQRRLNPALAPIDRETFVSMMTSDLPDAPAYFYAAARINRDGPRLLKQLAPPPPLSPEEVARASREGAVVLDTRSSEPYGKAHVPGSLNISLAGLFASWAGSLIALDSPVILVTENPEKVEEARTRLARVGIENVAGFLCGGIGAWIDAGRTISSIEQIGVVELERRLRERSAGLLIDVRQPGEWRAGHIDGASHCPLGRLRESLHRFDPSGTVTVICEGGYRSSAAAGILEAHGFTKVYNVVGGMGAWTAANLSVAAA